MSILVRRAVVVGSAFVVSVAFASAEARADAPSANDCVAVISSQSAHSLDMKVSNACERALTCEVRWTVVCEDAAGNVTRRAPGSSRFAIDASSSNDVTASAEACTRSWTVSDVTWSCAARAGASR